LNMKIGIYARGLSERVGGVKQYIQSMIDSMISVKNQNQELFIIHNCAKVPFNTDKPNVRMIRIETKKKMISDHLYAPKILNNLELDVAWFPKNVIPYRVKTPTKIVTIHDLAYFLPEFNAYPMEDTLYMKKMIRSSCKRADKIIAVSENTKRDIVNILKIDKAKIQVVYEAADPKYKSIKSENRLEEVRNQYRLPEDFILFTGGISPRKNLLRLVKAFNGISNKIPHHLVITGGKGWKNKEIIRAMDKNKKILRLGFVEDEDMPALYNLADLYVYPSLYEGFGLPILEAQACGCPVICSNTSSIPEVGRESVTYFDPINIVELQKKIIRLVGNDRLRSNLVRKGMKNTKEFSWDKSARELLEICSKV